MDVKVFTNGCFDIIHPGHVDLLRRARDLGTELIVGINSDDSVRIIKGNDKPYLNQNDRAEILKSIRYVDEVYIFDEQTPENLIKKIKPDVLVKGGDWAVDEIIGADFVLKNGGKVFSLPLKADYSSSSIAEKIKSAASAKEDSEQKNHSSQIINNALQNHLETFQDILTGNVAKIEKCAEMIFATFEQGNKVLICGNGGSAADAQHIAAEFVGRYETERKALPAIALTTDTSALTAVANDYGFERIFSRQVEALAARGDLLIAISTSGNSKNIISAVMTARDLECKTLCLTGADGKKLASLCDMSILVPNKKTARIQEVHIALAHIWCEIIDAKFRFGQTKN